HLVDDAHHGRRQLLGAVRALDHHRDVGLHAAQLLEEIDVEVGAAELAVGDRLQPDILLEPDDLGDRLVLDLAQLGRREVALRLFLARLEEVFRPEEAADVVGAEWRFCHSRWPQVLAATRVWDEFAVDRRKTPWRASAACSSATSTARGSMPRLAAIAAAA